MIYDLKPLKAPRTAGFSLKLLTGIAENSIGGKLIAPILLSNAGIPKMRSTLCNEAPTYLPQMPDFSHENKTQGRFVNPQKVEIPQNSFKFNCSADYVKAYKSGTLSPVDVADRLINAIEESQNMQPDMSIFISVDKADIMAQAGESTQRYRKGEPLGPFDGVPVSVKDEINQTPHITTVGTAFIKDKPKEDAFVVNKLREAGALLIGKTNMHEIGIGVTGVNPHHGAVRNPYDLKRATGGSSSGSAASVASGICPISVGADGGGSIRIPSAFCGVYGIKGTFGRVSEHGAAPLCWSVAHVGPIAATSEDLAMGYMLMSGVDKSDPQSQKQPVAELKNLYNKDLSGIKLGIFRPWFEDAQEDVVKISYNMLDMFKSMGAEIVDIEIPELSLLRTVHMAVIITEMATAHQMYKKEHRKDYGTDTRLNLSLARKLSSQDYIHAARLRTKLNNYFYNALKKVDVIVSPATGQTAPVIPEDTLSTGESNLEQTAKIMQYAQAGNLSGLPAISFPAGYDRDGMPVGFQCMGRAWEESLLLRLAVISEGLLVRKKPAEYFNILGE